MEANHTATRFTSKAHQRQRAVLVCYKIYRRRGIERAEAVARAIDRADRLLAGFAVLEASNYTANPILIAAQMHVSHSSVAGDESVRREALEHAIDCIQANPDHDEETLSHNIESNFPELDLDECDEIAAGALAKSAA